MNFVAKVKIKGKDEAVGLLDAFWDEFNPNSIIHIEGGEASLKIFFDEENLPKKISAALSICDDLEFHYGETESSKSNGNDDECDFTNKTMLDSNSHSEEGTNIPVKGKRGGRKKGSKNKKSAKEAAPQKDSETNSKNLENDKLVEFSKQASSYEEFAELIAKWLELKKRESLFVKLAILSKGISKITWPNLEKAAKENGFSFNVGDRNLMSGPVTQKMKDTNNPLRIIELFAAIALYKDFDFSVNSHESIENANNYASEESDEFGKDVCEDDDYGSSSATSEVDSDNSSYDGKQSSESGDKARGNATSDEEKGVFCDNGGQKDIESGNVPNISVFDEIFEKAKKSKFLKDKVSAFLDDLGVVFLNYNVQKNIYQYVETAILFKYTSDISEEMFNDVILKESNMLKNDILTSRMYLSKLINSFLNKKGCKDAITTIDLIKVMQTKFLSPSELANLKPF